ncbi:MAG: threonylcarbamoyl-AMP synthase [Oscillospiraceae bacterium]|jgi:L-threonylcarbamoyladenylate synthase|nr:threonylcarbamoyl-AMP synthase [Oscillospiraceae bacterium]
MKTLILKQNEVKIAVDLLARGEIVAVPTETVYGLAADATNRLAVEKIFLAKGRPQDNPLIVHIAKISDWSILSKSISKEAYILARKFWPGPLTIILNKTGFIPSIVTAGSNRVAVRMPNHKLALEIISKLGKPIAAPSANISGRPSPTCAEHVINDLEGKISAILDGGNCHVGIESSVIDMSREKIKLLRPGFITAEEISEIVNKPVEIDKSINFSLKENETVESPGTKYKHYAPNTKLILVSANKENFAEFVNLKQECGALCFDDDANLIKIPKITYGNSNDPKEQFYKLFDALRKIDDLNLNIFYVHSPKNHGLFLAVFNRLLRACNFMVIRL